MSKRNGKIELMRFTFCMCILFYHLNGDLWDGEKVFGDYFSFFSHGRTGVEFFFLLSGFFAAQAAYKSRKDGITTGKSTMQFLYKKIKSVFMPNLCVVLLTVVYMLFFDEHSFESIFERLPSIFFLQCTGLTPYSFIPVAWYIGAMLFALAILYPLLKKNYDITARVIAPVGSTLLLGYLFSTCGWLPSSNDLVLFISKYNLRALAVMLLGVFCFEVSRCLRNFKLSKPQSTALVVLENICWLFALYFMVSQLPYLYEVYGLYAFAVAITICLSRDCNQKIYNHSFVFFLGKISLPVYLCQNLTRNLIEDQFGYLSNKMQLVWITLLTVGLGIAIHYLYQGIRKKKTVQPKKQ